MFFIMGKGNNMKNDECITYLITKNGRKQIWYKDKEGWKQKSGKGIIRKVTAEQFLSHLLPALTKDYRNKVWIVVEKKKRKHFGEDMQDI